jgi:hypothetical protein
MFAQKRPFTFRSPRATELLILYAAYDCLLFVSDDGVNSERMSDADVLEVLKWWCGFLCVREQEKLLFFVL